VDANDGFDVCGWARYRKEGPCGASARTPPAAASASDDAVLTQGRHRRIIETKPVAKHFGGMLAVQQGGFKRRSGRRRSAPARWSDHLRPLGFGLKAEVLEYPGGMPGDIGFLLTWK